jgi:hypothetical protein
VYPVPGSKDEYWGLTDRGPNVTLPDGSLSLPLPSFAPSLGKFRLKDGKAELEKSIPLQDSKGHPYSGLVNSANSTGETMEDLNGNKLTTDPNGYDPEGLAVLKDGTFWVSDEYGPFITHFDSRGRALQRLSPVDGTLPAELLKRIPNKGMEGLTVTPDGKTPHRSAANPSSWVIANGDHPARWVSRVGSERDGLVLDERGETLGTEFAAQP